MTDRKWPCAKCKQATGLMPIWASDLGAFPFRAATRREYWPQSILAAGATATTRGRTRETEAPAGAKCQRPPNPLGAVGQMMDSARPTPGSGPPLRSQRDRWRPVAIGRPLSCPIESPNWARQIGSASLDCQTGPPRAGGSIVWDKLSEAPQQRPQQHRQPDTRPNDIHRGPKIFFAPVARPPAPRVARN